ncbi:MAG: hypothetical protein KGZ55_06660 [Sphingomonadaceae bacterium]|nr:hypothetical protein [Sphingomonadaceae bacterium]
MTPQDRFALDAVEMRCAASRLRFHRLNLQGSGRTQTNCENWSGRRDCVLPDAGRRIIGLTIAYRLGAVLDGRQ